MNRKPKLAAAPIAPASLGRYFSGQHSTTSATATAHSPPMPSEAMKRNRPRCHACGGEIAGPGEERVGQDADDHRAHAADLVAEPAEHQPARRRTEAGNTPR